MRLNQDANCFFPVESITFMNSASYEYKKMKARRRAQFVPIGMPTDLEDFSDKDTNILSINQPEEQVRG